MPMALLDHLRTRVVKDDESKLIWRYLIEGEEEPNMNIVSNGKCWPSLIHDNILVYILSLDISFAGSCRREGDPQIGLEGF
jgi:hypothetical protein